ncbi:MAG: DUF309 domain-containing protein [Verrucomicrobia bacterium]|nr:DUF309 domain-containing protein [Verrucomicrobiota bacterium]
MPHPQAAPLDPRHWRRCRLYLRGIDLFNHGYYWEAHEVWEILWHAAGRRGGLADFLKSLIALAAAGVKAREGRAAGVRQHASRALALFEAQLNQPKRQDARRMGKRLFMGLELESLVEAAARLEENPEAVLNTCEEAVVVVMPFRLVGLV